MEWNGRVGPGVEKEWKEARDTMHSRTFEKLFASRHSQRAKYRREGCRCTRERRAGPACACPRASTSGPLKLISRFINGQLPHLFFSPPFPSLPLTGSHVASLRFSLSSSPIGYIEIRRDRNLLYEYFDHFIIVVKDFLGLWLFSSTPHLFPTPPSFPLLYNG